MRIFTDKPHSDVFDEALSHSWREDIRAFCVCGREHLTKDNPSTHVGDTVIYHDTGRLYICDIQVDGKHSLFVQDCPCNFLGYFESLVRGNVAVIASYLSSWAEITRQEAEALSQTARLVDQSVGQIEVQNQG